MLEPLLWPSWWWCRPLLPSCWCLQMTDYSQAGSHITESLGTYLVTATCLTLDFIEFNSRVPPVCPFAMLSLPNFHLHKQNWEDRNKPNQSQRYVHAVSNKNNGTVTLFFCLFLPAAKPSRSYRAPIFFYLLLLLLNERVFLVVLNLLTLSSKVLLPRERS